MFSPSCHTFLLLCRRTSINERMRIVFIKKNSRPRGFDCKKWTLINPPITLTSTNCREAGDMYLKKMGILWNEASQINCKSILYWTHAVSVTLPQLYGHRLKNRSHVIMFFPPHNAIHMLHVGSNCLKLVFNMEKVLQTSIHVLATCEYVRDDVDGDDRHQWNQYPIIKSNILLRST